MPYTNSAREYPKPAHNPGIYGYPARIPLNPPNPDSGKTTKFNTNPISTSNSSLFNKPPLQNWLRPPYTNPISAPFLALPAAPAILQMASEPDPRSLRIYMRSRF